MAPFRWPENKHELALAREVAKYFPEKPQEWDEVAKTLSKAFSSDDKQVELKWERVPRKGGPNTWEIQIGGCQGFEKVCPNTSVQ